MLVTFHGTPKQIGIAYGREFLAEIKANLNELVWREGYEPLPREDSDFIAWHKKQESILASKWPWLLEEMAGVAEALAVSFEDILLLNLRAWQYNYYFAPPGQSCSSLAITLGNGTVACAGALDDPVKYYCGPVCFTPDNGYSFITFPITGTSWASRSLNETGLSIGISSQLLPGLRILDNSINQDLAIRVIMQTCTTVDQVREFCKEYPFTMNIVCVDASGGILCAHQTAAGFFEIPTQDNAALTNHLTSDDVKNQLTARGVGEFPESDTTHERRNNLLDFAKQNSGKRTAEDVMQFISLCDEGNPGTINRHNGGTVCLTFANPQNDPQTFWVMLPHDPECNNQFKQLKVSCNE